MTYNFTDALAEYNVNPYRPPVDRYIGANEITLSFDQNKNRLSWDSLHFPIYMNESETTANDAVPVVLYNNGVTDPTVNATIISKTGLATRYGGIAFTELHPQHLWDTQLGLYGCLIRPIMDAKCTLDGGTVPTVDNSFTIDAKVGVQMTEAFPGLDIGVQHNSAYYSRPIFTGYTTTTDNIAVSTSDTNSITSSRMWNQSLADEGYFIIDVIKN